MVSAFVREDLTVDMKSMHQSWHNLSLSWILHRVSILVLGIFSHVPSMLRARRNRERRLLASGSGPLIACGLAFGLLDKKISSAEVTAISVEGDPRADE